jgi:integrase
VVVDVAPPGAPRRRKYHDVHVANTRAGRKAAELREAELRLEVARGIELDWPGQGATETFGSYAAGWVDRKRGTWSPKTLKETRYALRRYILPALGATALERVTPTQIETLYANWAATGRANSARRRWHGMIRTIFADAERLGALRGPNPMVRVHPAGGRAPERRVPTPDEIRRVIDSIANPMTAAYFELAVASGARRGTLVALRWRDVDLAAGRVSFIQAAAQGESGSVLKENKGGQVYAVGLAGLALEALRAQHRRAAETVLGLGRPGGLDNLFVFSDDGGVKHWTLGWPSHAWQIASQRAGVAGVRLHDLRHFAATRMLAAGIPPRNVADRLGCTENNVIRTYSHRVPSPEDARATEIMAAVFG